MAIASQIPDQASNSSTPVPKPIQSDLKEEDYIAALSQLEEFQQQLAQARLAPRQISAAIGAIKDDPQSTIAHYQDVSSQAFTNIEKLKAAYQSPALHQIWLRSRELERRYRIQGFMNKLGPIEGVDVPLFGWVAKDGSLKEEKESEGGDGKQPNGVTENHNTSREEEQAIIDALKDEFITLTWESPAQETLLAVLQCKGSRLEFNISRDRGQSLTSNEYRVYLMGVDREHLKIGQSVGERRQKGDLRYLLELILSYRNWQFDKCDICKRILDKKAMHPLLRREPTASLDAEKLNTRFTPVHEQCVEA